MPTPTGKFVWYELLTSNSKAAEAFYQTVIGWQTRETDATNHPYTLLSAGETLVGGLMDIPSEAVAHGVKPCWSGYIGVDDVDDYVIRATKAGGVCLRPAEDIPGIGRFAVVADLQGAVFNLFKSACAQEPQSVTPGCMGHIGWHELHAENSESAFAFYSGLFGWNKAEAIDMEPMGIYQIFNYGGADMGGMMTRMPETPVPFWLFYFNVDALDAALSRVEQAGGQVIAGPMQVPGGQWIAQCLDPQQAIFALVAPER